MLARGCETLAFSYIGPQSTYPIYHHGTLGRAKADLQQAADLLNAELDDLAGKAHIVVCKALVTKASVFIPGLSSYLLALFRVMKDMGLHEGCIEQMQRLYADKLYSLDGIVDIDKDRLVRIDDREQRVDVQEKVSELLAEITPETFCSVGDYDGYKADFLKLNGFGLDGVDYDEDIDLAQFGVV